MKQNEMQLHIIRIQKRLSYLTRKQTHIHSRMDLIEENIAELKAYLDTFSAVPAKLFDLAEKLYELEKHLGIFDNNSAILEKKGGQ